MKHEAAVNGALFAANGRRILSWSDDRTSRLWDVCWRGDNLFEIACNYAPIMNSRKELDRLSNRYGAKIGELICQTGVRISI